LIPLSASGSGKNSESDIEFEYRRLEPFVASCNKRWKN